MKIKFILNLKTNKIKIEKLDNQESKKNGSIDKV
ncbi:hypothetical protein DFN06_000095 [Clostridium beijerinckii]|nr:hypothetical protein [Clostridium beijerinckii]NYB99402.1 hypothetical protein [Clostridium beijerinckii]SQB20292.1 Uncharacterised protein [Clostridium beijerinckii]